MLPSLKRKLGEASRPPPEPEAPPDPLAGLRGMPVGDSEDLRRIKALPRRPRPSDEEMKRYAVELKREFGRESPKCECMARWGKRCCDNLLPVQAWALWEARQYGGILGPIGVGYGKTLLDMLTPMVAGAKRAVVFLPTNLKQQFLDVDWHYYGQHWNLPNLSGGQFRYPGRPMLYVVAFSELSGAKSTELLDELQPDVVVVDEAHSLKNMTASRTKRFTRYFKKHPEVKLFAWSGTLIAKSIKDYAHHAQFSLHQGSPVPANYVTLEAWASALDPSDLPSPPGRLVELTAGAYDVREGFKQRVMETGGVISSGDAASCQASLTISEREVEAPASVQSALAQLEGSWQRPDGEELVDVLSKARCARELSCGFYYRWKWPRMEPIPVIEAWLSARKEWHKELREKLKHGGAHMDSPLLCTKAALRWKYGYTHIERDSEGTEQARVTVPPKTKNGPLPVWESEHWSRWEQLRDTAKPDTEAVWVDDFLVEDAIAWLEEKPGLCWYEFSGFADRLLRTAKERKLKLTFAGPGKDGDKLVTQLKGKDSVLISIRAHGTGKNLQQFSRNLAVPFPSDGATAEQLLGRTHRQGQLADEVTFDVYRHTEVFAQAVEKARGLASYIEGTFGAAQRLSSAATWNLLTR